MKRIFGVFLFLLLMVSANEVFATKIPDNELNVLKKTFPNVKVRFDGMVELPDGTNYIPVFPVQEIPQNSITVKQTIPKNKTLKDKPDFIMYNTNFAFFKLIKKDNKSTVVYNNDIPIEVKMGLLPQDLLVPQGFEIPGELRIIIGDLVIPVLPVQDYKEVLISQNSTISSVNVAPKTTLVTQAAKQLSNNYFYSTSFKDNAVTILNADNGKAFKKIEFNSIPSDIKLTNNGKYLLVTTLKSGKAYVIDTVKAQVLKEIKAGEKPSFIAISDVDNLAFIANRGEDKISILDLETMREKEELTIVGNPSYIVISDNANKIFYLDANSGTVYSMDKKDSYFEPYDIKPLFKTNNVSKIQVANDKIYAIDRGENELQIYYLNGKSHNDNMVNVSDIMPIHSLADNNEKIAVDYTYNVDEEQLDATSEKKTLKDKTKNLIRKVLYYNNPEEEPELMTKATRVEVLDKTINIADNQKTEIDKTHVKTAKDRFQDFLNYKAPEEPLTLAQEIKLKINQKMDLIKLNTRANDFLIVKDKLYLLCADDYLIQVFDINTNKNIGEFELPKEGYYNSIKVSKDNTMGMITNISTKELILFDTATDNIIQKLPLTGDVHNVVITGRK